MTLQPDARWTPGKCPFGRHRLILGMQVPDSEAFVPLASITLMQNALGRAAWVSRLCGAQRSAVAHDSLDEALYAIEARFGLHEP